MAATAAAASKSMEFAGVGGGGGTGLARVGVEMALVGTYGEIAGRSR